jgi:hypothetical protein
MIALGLAAAALMGGPGAAARERPTDDAREAVALAERYLELWSSPNDEMIEATPELYASSVRYYGRRIDRAALLAQKRRFADRWPVRSYRHRPGSIRAACEERTRICLVRSVYDYSVENPRSGKQGRGSSGLTIGVSLAGERPLIVSETVWRAPGAPAEEALVSRAEEAPDFDDERAVSQCRDFVTRAAARHGKVSVEVEPDGPATATPAGGLALPLAVKVVYARAGGPETRSSAVMCRFDAAGEVVGIE